jgi:hypothetical protein
MVQGPIQAVQNEIVAHVHTGLASHAVSSRRKKLALVIAGLADLIQLGLFPFFAEGALSIPDDVLDVVVVVLLLVTLGWRWRLLLALAVELVPGAALFPSWTAVVATLPAFEHVPEGKQLPPRE